MRIARRQNSSSRDGDDAAVVDPLAADKTVSIERLIGGDETGIPTGRAAAA